MNRPAALALAAAALALGFFARTPDTGGVSLRDFEAYYAAGSTWHYHGDPYGRETWRAERAIPGVIATHDELLPFVGPPFGLPLWDAFARLPWDRAAALWRIVVGCALAITVFACVRRATGRTAPFEVAAALVAAATFGPLTSGVALGQAASVSCAAIVAVPFLLEIRTAYAAAAGMLAAALQPNLALVLVLRLRGRRAWIAAAAALALAAGGSLVAAATIGGLQRYFAVVRDHAAAERGIAIQTTVDAVARGFGAGDRTAGAIAATFALAVIAGLAAQALSRRYVPNDLLALGCAAAPLAAPFAHAHDLNIAFLPALLAVRRARGGAWYAAIAATILIAVDWLGLVQRPGSALEATAFAVGTAAALVAFAPQPARRTWLIPLTAAGAVAAAAALVRGHLLPTWPDALPADFHVARSAGAAAVWAAEQRASGIAARDPVWAALRVAPLAGCAALWATGSRVFTASARSAPRATPRRPRVGVHPSV